MRLVSVYSRHFVFTVFNII